jgi:acyl carrier protein
MEKSTTQQLVDILWLLNLENFEDADSLDQLDVMLATENHFGITIPDEDRGTIESLEDLANVVDEIKNLSRC